MTDLRRLIAFNNGIYEENIMKRLFSFETIIIMWLMYNIN